MSNYRRLISYIYAYEGGIKGKNVGFAKLEVRNGQCKIQVNVRNVYIGSQDTGVYLLSGVDEILVGKIFIRNGAGEFRAIVSVGNVAGSGQTIDQCYGLTVHNLADSWQSYTTIWEDAVAHAAEVALEEATSEHIEKKEMNELPESQITAAKLEHVVENHKNSIAETVEAEIEAQDQPLMAELETMEVKPIEVVAPIASLDNTKQELPLEESETESVKQDTTKPEAAELKAESASDISEAPPAEPENLDETKGNTPRKEMGEQRPPEQQPEQLLEQPPEQQPEQFLEQPTEQQRPEQKPDQQRQGQLQNPQNQNPQNVQPQPDRMSLFGMPGWWGQQPEQNLDLQQNQQSKQLEPEHIDEEPKIDVIWQEFFKRYPKIQAFDYNGGCEILTIKPQDIGLLPRETWGYGNNSFLLHGYYNHRYLIFARLNNPKGEPRYLLGVPGHYYSNEKYMAAMFGFPNFVLSKIQPAGDGRFGYWYTDVRMSS